MIGDDLQTQGPSVSDYYPEYPFSCWKCTDMVTLLLAESGSNKLDQPSAGSQYSQRAVGGAHQLPTQVGDVLEHHIQGKLRREGADSFK